MDALASLLGSSVPFERRDAEEAEVDRRTAYQWLREICSFSLMRAPQIVLGGPGVIVHIDESLFCHKLKVHMSIENNWGRPTTRDLGVWNGKHINLSYMEVVQRRDAATLLPIIMPHTGPSTVIHSNMWAAYYARVQNVLPVAAHNTANHSRNFVDPVTGVHTQNIESYWNK